MAKQKEQIPERIVLVTIRSRETRKAVTFETWRYWEIVGELMFRRADRFKAYDAARWCGRIAKPGDSIHLSPDITLEVHEDA